MKQLVARLSLGLAAASLMSSSGLSQQAPAAPAPVWTWMSGSNTVNPLPVYGSKGVAAAANVPGGRSLSAAFTDAAGDFWLFGGHGIDKFNSEGFLNDLWRFNGTNWTWISGGDVINRLGVYGTKGVAAPSNIPGSRQKSAGWAGPNGNFWIFGGEGMGATGNAGTMNDFWKFDGTNWTWVGGTDTGAQGVYTAKGVASPVNWPGSRTSATTWTDGSGNLWMFGGYGYDLGGHSGLLNELWKYDGANWTWVSGNLNAHSPGVYGTEGVPGVANIPGSRQDATSWVDNAGNFYIYGGYGVDATGPAGYLNDLWKFDGANWTWVAGAPGANAPGVYGTKGVAAPGNEPGGRSGALGWVEPSGLAYVFGGTSASGSFNDTWTFDGSSWTWVSGSNTINAHGVYGTKKKAAPGNVPGARSLGVRWRDNAENLWHLGGVGYAATGGAGQLNDLWRMKPGVNPNAPPPAPTGVAATPGNGAVRLTWNASMGAVSYIVHRSLNHNPQQILQTGITSLSFLDTGVTDGLTYYYRIKAQGVGIRSAYSAEVSATPSDALPLPPVLTATAGNSQVALSWSATGDSYQVSRSEIDGGPYAPLGLPVTATALIDTSAVNDTQYYYIVVATNAAGSGLPSNQAAAKPAAPVSAMWTWTSGSATANQVGVYGTKGVASPANIPGARAPAATWSDAAGNFWLFGGTAYDPNYFLPGQLSDLWKFDGTNWTWVAGPATFGEAGVGVYGTKGVPAAGNYPGGRWGSASWVDNSGNLWLFGGTGYDGGGSRGEMNDLWKFNGSQWTWVAGSNLAGQAGVYGTKGVPAAANTPGARQIPAFARDAAGNFWLFGGETPAQSRFWNDLWKFNGSQWTWVSGSNVSGELGVWGTKGVAAPGNVISSRSGSSAWVNASGQVVVFGGYGPVVGSTVFRNDLWRFDGVNWTWIAGTDQMNPPGVPGSKGTPDPANTPGGRAQGMSWKDPAGTLWFFGGIGYDSSGGLGSCNDLWKFDGAAWAWMSGALTVWQSGVYGTKGVPAPANVPGARSDSGRFVDLSGNLWIFGGRGNDSVGTTALLNDLWRWGP